MVRKKRPVESILVDCDADYDSKELCDWCKRHNIKYSANGSNREIVLLVETSRLEDVFDLLHGPEALQFMHTFYFPPKGGSSNGGLRRIFAGPAAERERRQLEFLPKLSATPAEILKASCLRKEGRA
jgi:hypothetical protein